MRTDRLRVSEEAQGWLAAAALLFAVLCIVVVLLTHEDRDRFTAACQLVTAFATAGAVAVAFIALRQLDLQRIALIEQRKAFELGRFADLRGEYARWLGAGHDLYSFLNRPLPAAALTEYRELAEAREFERL
jgi:hypothetical protein